MEGKKDKMIYSQSRYAISLIQTLKYIYGVKPYLWEINSWKRLTVVGLY